MQTIREYVSSPIVPPCPEHFTASMERKLCVVPSSALSNALSGDRHYEGLRGPKGEDIGSRSKHRAYMRENNLTTIDDFKGQLSQAADERTALRTAQFQDKELRSHITEQVMTAVAQPD